MVCIHRQSFILVVVNISSSINLSLVSLSLLASEEASEGVGVLRRLFGNRIAGPGVDPLKIFLGTEVAFGLLEIALETRPVFDFIEDLCSGGAILEVLVHHSHDQILEIRSIVVVDREGIQIEFASQFEVLSSRFPALAVVWLRLLASLHRRGHEIHDQTESPDITLF